VKRADGFRIVETLDRSSLWAAATPQVFRADWLRAALEGGREATDESALIEADGHSVVVVPVSRLAFKITTPEDLALAEAWLARRPA
jgi:2-C-methyl-D-erythritol 4-phosphate cytidylyltransferase